jgi:hypothetical protein
MLESLEINVAHRNASANQTNKLNKNTNSRQFSTAHVSAKKQGKSSNQCVICKQQYHLYQCKEFLALSVTQRVGEIKKHQLCLNCLRAGHISENCLAGNCKTCHKKHNSLLHFQTTGSVPSDQPLTVASATHHVQTHDKNIVLSTAIVQVTDKNGNKHQLRALLDSGSQSNFLTENAAQKLGCHLNKLNLPIIGINQGVTTVKKATNIQIHSNQSSFKTSLFCLIVPKITENLPLVSFDVKSLNLPNNIRFADPQFHVSRPIDLLIGNEQFWNLICIGQIRSNKAPTLQKTQLGWIIAGEIPPTKSKPVVCNLAQISLEQQLKQFWELESFDHSKPLSADETICEEFFRRTTQRDSTGRFIVRLPFRTNPPNLGPSRNIAVKRFYSVENKLKRDKSLHRDYKSFLDDYEARGHLERLSEGTLVNLPATHTYFLPHHPVFKPESTTTKLRVVFDGSCQSSNGKSLNDNLFVGPALQQELFCILTRFLTHQYVITGDIEKMYRQIRVHPDDCNYQLILWRDQPNTAIETYRLLTVSYGLNCSPYLAQRCLQELAVCNAERFPEAHQVILRDFYVNDLLTGADSVDALIKIREEVTIILSEGGFQLRKFSSNAKTVLQSSDEIASNEIISLDKQGQNKVLGINWDCSSDNFRYSVNIHHVKNTKRGILSVIAKLFDPLGLVTPITISAKIILQRIWTLKLDWDESLPADIHTMWRNFLSTFSQINNIRIPRKVINDRSYSHI